MELHSVAMAASVVRCSKCIHSNVVSHHVVMWIRDGTEATENILSQQLAHMVYPMLESIAEL